MSSALEARLAQEMARKVAIPIAERVAQETAVPVARETATIVAEQTAQDAADAFHAANPPIPGPQGHKGNTGDTGSTGGAGPQGGKGDKGLNWRGPWSRGAYQPDDAVEADGSSYVATAQTRSKPPSSSWDLLAQKGEPGAPGSDGQFHAYPRGGGGVTVQDEGTNIGPVSTLDFEGAGVTVTQPQGGKAVVTIPGGGGSGLPAGGTVGQVVTNTGPGAGDWETPTPVGTPITDTFTGDGAQTTFTLSQTATGTWGIAAVNGAQLLPSEFAVSGTSVVFDVAPADLAEVAVTYVWGGGLGAPARGYFEVVSKPYTYDQFVDDGLGHFRGPLFTTLAVGDKVLIGTYRVLVAFDDSIAGPSGYATLSDSVFYNYIGTDPIPAPGLAVVNTGDHGMVSILTPEGPNVRTTTYTLTASYAPMEPDSTPVAVYPFMGVPPAGDGTQGTVRLDLWVWRAPV